MGRIVIVAYKPKIGKEEELELLMKTHVEKLRHEGLVTDRDPVIMRSGDRTVVEVFEWKSKQAIETAHTNAAVQEMWKNYAEICEYVPIANVAESTELFSQFTPLN